MAVSLDEILKLSIEERLELVASIWDSIADGVDTLPMSDSQRRMLDDRLDDLAKNPDLSSPWPEVKARILSKK